MLDSAPIFAPAIPFGFVVGVAVTESAMPTSIAFASSFVIWAGSAQLAALTLAGTASWLTVVATCAIINSRHVMYSAAMSPRFRDQPRWFRWLGPYLMIDQIFALANAADDLVGHAFRRYYLTVGWFFWVGWHLAVAAGMVLGSSVPESWQLGVAPAVMFTGFVVLAATRRPAVIAAVVAALTCFLTLGLPNRLGLLVGAVAGVIAGYIADRDDPERGEPARSDPARGEPARGHADGDERDGPT